MYHSHIYKGLDEDSELLRLSNPKRLISDLLMVMMRINYYSFKVLA